MRGVTWGFISKTVRVVPDGDQELVDYFGSDTWKITEQEVRAKKIVDNWQMGI